MRVKILRQRAPFTEPYWETFSYEGSEEATVAGLLDELNYRDDITDIEGNLVPRISWECSCLQGMCGSCAMVINGVPALACETFVKDLGEEIVIEPLKKFMTISDLVVDRGPIWENLLSSNSSIGEYEAGDPKEHPLQYAAAKCLKCGLCLEVCPNYVKGEKFFGALFANDCYLIATRSREGEKVKEAYGKHFAAGCSKSLSCMDVCPAGIPLLTAIARMNRKG